MVGVAILLGLAGGSIVQITAANAATTNSTTSAKADQNSSQNQQMPDGNFKITGIEDGMGWSMDNQPQTNKQG